MSNKTVEKFQNLFKDLPKKNQKKSLKTFCDLYNYLQEKKFTDISEWLVTRWKGKDKQESLLRLFAGLGLISKLNEFNVCNGNFNNGTIEEIKTLRYCFYQNENEISLKDKGDKSDLTLKKRNFIFAISSKNNEKQRGVGCYDIHQIVNIFNEKYGNNNQLIIVLCTRYKDDLIKKAENANTSSSYESNIILNKTDIKCVIIDWSDLNEAYHNFLQIYGMKSLDEIVNNKIDKYVFLPKPHQEYSIEWTVNKLKNGNEKEVIWGHIPRSGKSYIMTGMIIKDSVNKEKCNYLIITTAPNETIKQYQSALRCRQLHDFNVLHINDKTLKKPKSNKNVIICSKQFLQIKTDKKDKGGNVIEKTESIGWLSKMKFDIRFLDEAHQGGSTELSKTTLKKYGNGCFTIYMTATYFKPTFSFKIKRENVLLWDLEDVVLCKEYKRNIERLREKHGEGLIKIFDSKSNETIFNEYNKYPELHILTDEFTKETVEKVVKMTRDNDFGFSTTSSLLLNQDENGKTMETFQSNEKALDIFYKIFGKKQDFGIPEPNFSNNFMKKIENKCKEKGSRYMKNMDEPMVVMCFLPQNNIDELSNATKELLETNKVIPEYEIVIINSKVTHNPKDLILNAVTNAKNKNKKGVLVLSGKQCSVGVTINNCDVVILLNNNKSYDMIYQMMFRCMTEGINKRCGFVIDMDMYRVTQICMQYAHQIKPNLHLKQSFKYLFSQKIINVNEENYQGINIKENSKKLNKMTEMIYKVATADTIKYIETLLNRLTKYELNSLTKEQIKLLNSFSISSNKNSKIKMNGDGSDMNNGIETNKKITGKEPKNVLEEEIVQKKSFMDILKHIIPLICILTISSNSFGFEDMYNEILVNEELKDIFLKQLQSWWGSVINEETLKKVLSIYIDHMSDNTETNQLIKTIKEIFINSKGDMNELSRNIDKYLIPEELEKKNNAEVSTPYKLRNEMLDKIPNEFWKTPKKVFEPCCGKGGFIVDIVNRFMDGLKDLIPNNKERMRTIVEDCLYFSDINKTNIFICEKLLENNGKEYKLNSNLGNTLELDIKEKWGLDGFDAVIGNPPYNSSGGIKKGGKNLYTKFVEYSINIINNKKYLLFIVPTGIFKTTNNDKTKYLKNILNNELIYVNINECARHFNVGSTFTYFLLEKNNKKKIGRVDSLINNNLFTTNKIDNFNLNYIPILLSNEVLSILNKISFGNFNFKRIDNKKKLEKDVEYDEFLYMKRLNHINHKKPYLKILVGNKNMDIKGPILVEKYDKNIEYILKSKLFAFINIITRYDAVIYHKFFNSFGFPKINKNINNEKDIYELYKLTENEIKLIKKVVR